MAFCVCIIMASADTNELGDSCQWLPTWALCEKVSVTGPNDRQSTTSKSVREHVARTGRMARKFERL
jgi:hypothetical protein